ncbi:MAG: NAD(P)H-quinone oxidoreductase, partial [Pyrinomonadaceae bacterium]
NLEVREVDDLPKPSGTKVKVRVHAAALNRADLLQVRGLYPPPTGYSPNIPGLEFAGEVVEVGDEVTGLDPGTRVFGIASGEGQAEFIVSDASLLVEIPERLSYVEAACVPEAFITAHDAIVTQGRLTAGDTLLIHAVGSGVGLAALQIAKSWDVFVVGTSRTEDKLERAREFGLDAGIVVRDVSDISAGVLEATQGRGANVILDLVGGDYFPEDLKSLPILGRVVLVGLTAGRTAEIDLGTMLQKRAHVFGTVLRPRSLTEKAEATQAFARDVLPHLAGGRVRPNLDRTFALSDVREAYSYLASNKSFGKVVLEFIR